MHYIFSLIVDLLAETSIPLARNIRSSEVLSGFIFLSFVDRVLLLKLLLSGISLASGLIDIQAAIRGSEDSNAQLVEMS